VKIIRGGDVERAMEDVLTGDAAYLIHLDGTENAEFRAILEGWLDALEYHEFKSKGYKNRDKFSLGIRGEFVGFWRKAQKLYSSVWEDKPLVVAEGTQEVLMDAFGSLGLMLHALKVTSDKYSAAWRDNHGNKPTFGPGPQPTGKFYSVTFAQCPSGKGRHEFVGNPAFCKFCNTPESVNFSGRSGV